MSVKFTNVVYLFLLVAVMVGLFVGSAIVSSPPLSPRTVTVEARELRFEPTTIRVRVGRPIHLELINNGYVSHNLEIPELEVATEMIPPGSSSNRTLRVDEPGRYRFLCDIASHLEAGMEGRLVVR